jgi:hypothetical protein
VPSDLVCCFLLNGLRRSPRVALLLPCKSICSRCTAAPPAPRVFSLHAVALHVVATSARRRPTPLTPRPAAEPSRSSVPRAPAFREHLSYILDTATAFPHLVQKLSTTTPPAAGLALAPASPHRSRARSNCVRSWPASCLAYTARLLLTCCRTMPHHGRSSTCACAACLHCQPFSRPCFLRCHQPCLPALLLHLCTCAAPPPALARLCATAASSCTASRAALR